MPGGFDVQHAERMRAICERTEALTDTLLICHHANDDSGAICSGFAQQQHLDGMPNIAFRFFLIRNGLMLPPAVEADHVSSWGAMLEQMREQQQGAAPSTQAGMQGLACE